MSRIVAIFKAVTRNWLRSRSGVFFSFLFPVMLLLLFGSVFGSPNATTYSLYVQNSDSCQSGSPCLSQAFVHALNSTKVLDVKAPLLGPDVNATAFVKDRSSFFGQEPRALVIPSNFSSNLSKGLPVRLTYVSSPADQLSPIVLGVVSDVSNAFTAQRTGPANEITLSTASVSFRQLRNVDYYVPGYIGAFMMTNGVIGLTNTASEFKRRGLTKRLSATPLSRLEWVVGNVLSQALLAVILTAIMVALGYAIYGVSVNIDAIGVATILVGAVLFSGIGMLLAGVVRDTEAASGLGNAIAFPMMFLSGTFWPIDIMPNFLQQAARILPLSYFSDGLRDTMILANSSAALFNLGILSAFAVAFILLGATATRWTER